MTEPGSTSPTTPFGKGLSNLTDRLAAVGGTIGMQIHPRSGDRTRRLDPARVTVREPAHGPRRGTVGSAGTTVTTVPASRSNTVRRRAVQRIGR